MFTNVIVPLDGSRQAEAAIPVARTLAALGGGRLSLLRVVHRPAGVFASHVNQVREASGYLEKIVRDTLAGVNLPIATRVRSGEVVEAILNEVDESASNVIVMTSRGHSGVLRAVLGSVASELLGRSPVPVVLVRAGARPIHELRHILVPVDGARESEQAVVTAAELARSTAAKVTLLQVVTPAPAPTWALEQAAPFAFEEYVDPGGTIDCIALEESRQSVDTLAYELQMGGISAEGMALLGDVPDAITEIADALRTDLIVMRTRGRTGVARAVLGSVADTVARSAAAPVMLLRGDGAERPGATRHEGAPVLESVW
jgi:nucleotide-binding universal stress UspA family protein